MRDRDTRVYLSQGQIGFPSAPGTSWSGNGACTYGRGNSGCETHRTASKPAHHQQEDQPHHRLGEDQPHQRQEHLGHQDHQPFNNFGWKKYE